jgi:lysozyme
MSKSFEQDRRNIQKELKSLGFYNRKIDGIFGEVSYDGIFSALRRLRTCLAPAPNISFLPTVDYRLALEVASHEAIIRQAYLDAKNVWTWSVGLTGATGHKVDRYIDAPQSMQHCINIYVWALKNYAKHVDEVFKGFTLTPEEYAGAVSFHWNTGAIRRALWVDAFKQGDINRAEELFMDWSSGGLLTARRKKEADLIWRGVWHNNGTITEFTRVTSKYVPVWSSAVPRLVLSEVQIAFGANVQPMLDQPPQPENVPLAPTLSVDAI